MIVIDNLKIKTAAGRHVGVLHMQYMAYAIGNHINIQILRRQFAAMLVFSIYTI